MSISTSSSNSHEFDNQNRFNMGAFRSNKGHFSHVPISLGSQIPHYPLPTSHLPYPLPSSGQLQVDSSPGNYVISSNSLPITGREYFPQVGNLSLSSQDSWCQGLRQDRNPSSPEFTSRVCQVVASNDFQGIFNEARNYVEHVYTLLREFFDRSQILALEESHRILDSMITRLAPFASQSTESHNVYELVKALRVTQSRIEEKLINYFQSLDERYRMLVTFTLPQLRDHSYISFVNRSVQLNQSVRNRSLSPNSSLAKNASISYDHVKTSSPIKGESKVPQFVNNSFNDRSISPNSSPIKNSSKNFANVKMSTPNKNENKVPEFSPPLEKNIIKDDSILQGANHKVRINAVPSDSAVPLISSVSSVASVPLVSFALSIPSVSLVTSVSSVPAMSLVTSVPSVKSVPLVTSVPLVKSVPSVKSEPLVTSVPLAKSVSSVTSAQNEKN